MSKPSSRQELIDYCLRQLGHPVVEVNVDPDQIDDRIDESLEKFHNWHFDGTQRTFLKHNITQQEIDDEYIPIDDSIISIVRLFPFDASLNTGNLFNLAFVQTTLGDIHNFGGSGGDPVTNFSITKQYINLLDDILIGEQSLRFNRHMNRVHLDLDWSERFNAGDTLLFEVFQIIDPEEFTDVYNDEYLKKYATALIKMQWGTNLKKFEGVQLPGGITMNGQQIFEEAQQELERLEEELKNKFEVPPLFFIG